MFSENPSTRHRVVVTMTRGDETARRFGDPLQFEYLGGTVLQGSVRGQGSEGADKAWVQDGHSMQNSKRGNR